MGKDNY